MLIGLHSRLAVVALALCLSGAPAALASSPPDLAKLASDVEQLRTISTMSG